MLSANEFTVASLADAKPLSLLLPRNEYDATFLVGGPIDRPIALFLGERHQYVSMECDEATNWFGLLIPSVRIEIDETSLFDVARISASPGTLVRTETQLKVSAIREQGVRTAAPVILETNLSPATNLSVGFTRWRIVIGEGFDKRVLREVDAALYQKP